MARRKSRSNRRSKRRSRGSRRARRSRGSKSSIERINKARIAKFYKLATVDALKYCPPPRGYVGKKIFGTQKESKKCKQIQRQLKALERPSKKYVVPGVATSLAYEMENWSKLRKQGKKARKGKFKYVI
jgi:hypothetical protein